MQRIMTTRGRVAAIFLLALTLELVFVLAFVGLLAGMATVGAVNFLLPAVAFLWHNVIGAVVVVIVGMLLSLGGPPAPAAATPKRA